MRADSAAAAAISECRFMDSPQVSYGRDATASWRSGLEETRQLGCQGERGERAGARPRRAAPGPGGWQVPALSAPAVGRAAAVYRLPLDRAVGSERPAAVRAEDPAAPQREPRVRGIRLRGFRCGPQAVRPPDRRPGQGAGRALQPWRVPAVLERTGLAAHRPHDSRG